MKNLIFVLSLSFFTFSTFSQTVGIGTENPNTKSALDIQSTGIQGILIPRLKSSDTSSFLLSTTDKGMLFYDTISTNIMVWTGNNWRRYKSYGENLPTLNTWNVGGNATILPQLVLGTNTNSHIDIKTNNTNALTIGNNGRIAVGNLDNKNKLTSDLVVRRSETATNGTNGVFIDIINENTNTANSLNGIRFSNYPTTTTNTHTSGALFFQGDGGAGGNGKFILANRNGAGTVTVNDGKFSVDKFGHTGIGTITTTHRLEVIEPSDNIKLILSNDFNSSYGLNMSTVDKGKIALTLEDGTFQQALVIGDFGTGDNTKNYFGISQSQNSGTSWQPDLVVSYNGDIGIGISSPQARLNVNGNLALTPLYLKSIPSNAIINHDKRSIIIIDDQISDFVIEGIIPAADGTILHIINFTNHKMTVVDKSSSVPITNRIETLKNGADYSTNLKGSITLVYSTKHGFWISTGSNN